MNLLRSTHTLRSTRIPQLTRPQVRHFHPTKPAQLTEVLLDASAGLVHGVHSLTGLPWAASIPLTAFLVRTTIGLPLQVYTRIQARRELNLVPLLHAWGKYYKDEARQYNNPFQATSYVLGGMKKRKKELYQIWHISGWYRYTAVLALPFWLLMMDSLRGMCGMTYILSSIIPQADAASATKEPSLATEGAFWFPDLLAGDPTGTLPAMLAASILFNIRTGWAVSPVNRLADLPNLQMYLGMFSWGMRIFLQLFAINVGYACYVQDMPTALLIYWITSSTVASVYAFLLNKFLSLKPPLKPFNPIHTVYRGPGSFKHELK